MVVVVVLAAVRVLVVICSNLFNCGGICGVCSGYCVINGCFCSSLAPHFHHYPHHNHDHHNQPHHHLHHTAYTYYGNSGDGGGSEISWVMMVVVGMVRFWWY